MFSKQVYRIDCIFLNVLEILYSDQGQCGGTIYLDAWNLQKIESPGYPNQYPSSKTCLWNIIVQPPKVREVNVQKATRFSISETEEPFKKWEGLPSHAVPGAETKMSKGNKKLRYEGG